MVFVFSESKGTYFPGFGNPISELVPGLPR
jgi:hypothetical protein